MRFSSIVVLAAIAPVANGFAPFQRQFSAPRTVLRKVEYDLDLGIDEPTKKGGKKVKPTPAPEPVPEPAPAPKSKRQSAKKEVEPKPTPAPAPKSKAKPEPAPEPAPKAKPKKESKPKKVKPEALKIPPPPPPPPRVKEASVATKASGVALGAAPLVLAPAALLVAGRGVLTGTVERRAKIQQEIEEIEKAKRKKQLQSEIDTGDLAKAVVRSLCSLYDGRTDFLKV